LELERKFIERTDFSSARRGYAPEEVDRHLREVADAVEKAAADSQGGGDSLGSLASEQIRAIVEAAETSAGEIQAQAQADAEKVTADAEREAAETRRSAQTDAQKTRTDAEHEAASHVQRVQDATGEIATKAEAIDSELEGLVSGVRSTVGELTDRLRREAEDIAGQLRELREGLSDIRTAVPGGSATTSVAAGGTSTTSAVDEDVIEEVDEQEAEVARQAANEEEPELIVEEDEELKVVEEAREEPGVDEPGTGKAVEEEDVKAVGVDQAPAASSGEGSEGARLIALNMALNGTPRDETARYLEENFDLADQDSILDEVYARAGG